jgi:hypothetical protein
MKAVFIELPVFERHRDNYLDEESFSQLQGALMANPAAGDLIEGTGGLRKLRFGDSRRSKGTRGWAARDLLLLDRWTGVLAVHVIRQG